MRILFASLLITTIVTITAFYMAFFPIAPVAASSLNNVQLNEEVLDFSNEIYAFVHRMLNKHVIHGITRGDLPLTWEQVASILLDISEKQKSGDITLSKADQSRLKALLELFADELPPDYVSPSRRLHLLQTKGGIHNLAFDLSVSQRLISRTSEAFAVGGTAHITSVYPRVHGQIGNSFAFSTNIGDHFIYGEKFGDLFQGESFYHHFEGDLLNRIPMDNYMKFRFPWFELELGQDQIHWGPGYHGALLVSENPTSIDMIKIKGSYGPVTFSGFTGILEDQDQEINEKYISGHRIELYLWNRFGLAMSEVIIYGNRFEPTYLNPINMYVIDIIKVEAGDSRAEGTGDNALASIDLRFRPINDLEIYGEFLFDDGNPANDFYHWDTKFGILGGFYITDPLGVPDTDFHAEYAFINQYAYTHENPVNIYKHFSSPIGHHIGSDADNLWIDVSHRFMSDLEASLTYELERHGEGNINRSHPLDAPADDQWTPLSGITQTEHRFSLGVNYTTIGRYSFAVELAQIWMRNKGNQSEVDESGREVKLKALYRF